MDGGWRSLGYNPCGGVQVKIEVRRKWFTENTTSSIIRLDGEWFCFGLEDVARPYPVKIPGKTCIWPGEYPLVLDFSQRFQKVMPHILNVPLFDGIRIHAGNNEFDTAGCLLVGCGRTADEVWRSRDAFDALFRRLKEASDKGEPMTIEFINDPI